jgi:hypothetical protein
MAFLTHRCAIPAPSEIVPELPVLFDDWMRKACAADPAERFADATTMARALRAAALPS